MINVRVQFLKKTFPFLLKDNYNFSHKVDKATILAEYFGAEQSFPKNLPYGTNEITCEMDFTTTEWPKVLSDNYIVINDRFWWVDNVRRIGETERYRCSFILDTWNTYKDKIEWNGRTVLIDRKHCDRWLDYKRTTDAYNTSDFALLNTNYFSSDEPVSLDYSVANLQQLRFNTAPLPVGKNIPFLDGLDSVAVLKMNSNIRSISPNWSNPNRPLEMLFPLSATKKETTIKVILSASVPANWPTASNNANLYLATYPQDNDPFNSNVLNFVNGLLTDTWWSRGNLKDVSVEKAMRAIFGQGVTFTLAGTRENRSTPRVVQRPVQVLAVIVNYGSTVERRWISLIEYEQSANAIQMNPATQHNYWSWLTANHVQVNGTVNVAQYKDLISARLFVPLNYLSYDEAITLSLLDYSRNDTYLNGFSAFNDTLISDNELRRNLVLDKELKAKNYFSRTSPAGAGEFKPLFKTKYYLFYCAEMVSEISPLEVLKLSNFYKDTAGEAVARYFINSTGITTYLTFKDDSASSDILPTQFFNIVLPSALPSETDPYTNYINNNLNSYQTNLSIANQQQALGLVGTALGGLGALASTATNVQQNGIGSINATTGLGLIGAGASAVSGVFGAINQKRRIEAQNQDLKRQGETIIGLSNDTIKNYSYFIQQKEQSPNFSGFHIVYAPIMPLAEQALVRFCYEFGYNYGFLDNINDWSYFATRSRFNFVQGNSISHCIKRNDDGLPVYVFNQINDLFSAGFTLFHDTTDDTLNMIYENWENKLVR